MREISGQSGFTLVELMVSVGIIGLMATIIASAYPAARDHQALQSAKQQIQAALQEALQMAMNDNRYEGCGTDPQCSDIGIYFSGNKLIMFADKSDDNDYTTSDTVIQDIVLVGGVRAATTEGNHSYLFRGEPPAVRTIVDGNYDVNTGDITLTAGANSSKLTISSFGKIKMEDL